MSLATFLIEVESTTKGTKALVDTLEFHNRTKNAAKFTAWSHYPCHLSFAIKSIRLGVDRPRVKDSLTLLSLAVRPAASSCLLSPVSGWSLSGSFRYTSDVLEHFLYVLSDKKRGGGGLGWAGRTPSHSC